MSFTLQPLSPSFAAEAGGVDLRQPHLDGRLPGDVEAQRVAVDDLRHHTLQRLGFGGSGGHAGQCHARDDAAGGKK